MIGLILWAILIFIIACASCPGFLTILFTVGSGYIALYIIFSWLKSNNFKLRKRRVPASKRSTPTSDDREQAIDEWERKWKRTHPTRINKKH